MEQSSEHTRESLLRVWRKRLIAEGACFVPVLTTKARFVSVPRGDKCDLRLALPGNPAPKRHRHSTTRCSCMRQQIEEVPKSLRQLWSKRLARNQRPAVSV